MGKKWIIIFGATSTLGRAMAHQWARNGYSLILIGRLKGEVERCGADFKVRYECEIRTIVCDAESSDFPQAILNGIKDIKEIFGLVWTWGVLGSSPSEVTASEIYSIFGVNLSSAVVAMETLLSRVVVNGFIVLVSSVAGDRGRRSNYIYGAAKSGLTTYGQGLRHRLASRGICVSVIKLGVVDTQMTRELEGVRAAISPDMAAKQIIRHVGKGHGVVYVPFKWRWIMLIIRWIPEVLFNYINI